MFIKIIFLQIQRLKLEMLSNYKINFNMAYLNEYDIGINSKRVIDCKPSNVELKIRDKSFFKNNEEKMV